MSKSDHARKPRSAAKRAASQDEAFWQWLDSRSHQSRVLPKNEAITEQVMASLDESEPADQRTTYDKYVADAPLGIEPVAEWEWELLGRPASTAYSTESHVQTDAHLRECSDCSWDYAMQAPETSWDLIDDTDADRIDDAWDDKYGRDPFMPCLSIQDAYKEFGDDGWHITGPVARGPMWNEENRRLHYYRVWELARSCNLTSKEMVRHLRLNKEFVKHHFSLIALPIAERVMADFGVQPHVEIEDPISQLRRILS